MIFLLFALNIHVDCGYTLEPPYLDDEAVLTSTHNICLRAKQEIVCKQGLCCDYIKKYSRPIGFLYFYRPINTFCRPTGAITLKT